MVFFNKRPMCRKKQAVGKRAEQKAFRYLASHGLKLLEKNYHSRFGEIDLIMSEGETIVFIEVRSRGRNAQVDAATSVTQKKINRIQKTAKYYLTQYQTLPNCRFDVVAMTHDETGSWHTLDWIKGAF